MNDHPHTDIPEYGLTAIPGVMVGGSFYPSSSALPAPPPNAEAYPAAPPQILSISKELVHVPRVRSESPNAGRAWNEMDLLTVMIAVAGGASYQTAGKLVDRSASATKSAIRAFDWGSIEPKGRGKKLRQAFKRVPEEIFYDDDEPLTEGLMRGSAGGAA